MTTSQLLILQPNKFDSTTPTNVITTSSIQPRNMGKDIVPFVPTRDLKINTNHCHWSVESANYLPKKLSRSWMIQMPVQPVVSPTVPMGNVLLTAWMESQRHFSMLVNTTVFPCISLHASIMTRNHLSPSPRWDLTSLSP